jgi:hypothetical protein
VPLAELSQIAGNLEGVAYRHAGPRGVRSAGAGAPPARAATQDAPIGAPSYLTPDGLIQRTRQWAPRVDELNAQAS